MALDVVSVGDIDAYSDFQALPTERLISTIRLMLPLVETLALSDIGGSRSARELLKAMGRDCE